MSNWPTSVRYLERLALDENGQPTAIDVEIPSSRSDTFDLLRTIDRLSREDPVPWKATVRQYTASDWYVLGLFMSGAQRLDPFTGRPEMDCDFLWNHYREMQFEGDNVLNKGARQHHKTHIRGYVGITNAVLVDPNEIIAFVAHQKAAAAKHCMRTGREWETNVELKTAWDDVFFADPKRDPDCPMWNQETGFTVRRTISAALPTLSWYAIEEVPVGARVSLFMFDDVETEATVESEGQREKVLARFASFQELAGRVPRVWINGTHFHPNGLIAHLEKSKAYAVKTYPAEDISKPAPDIAKMFDDCGGKLPLRDENRVVPLPIAVRDIRLDGAAVFLHPLELAWKRLRALSTPGGLANYYMQNMGDSMAGQEKRLEREWIRWYDIEPAEMAEGAYLYIVVDASKGVNDPTFARVEACLPDGTIAWVGGLRKKIPPSEFGKEMYQLGCEWEGLGVIKEYRFEIFGQAVWDSLFVQHCEKRNHWPGGIGPLNVKAIGRNKTNRLREWTSLEVMYRAGRRLYPRRGIWVEDENRQRFNLVDHYIDNEYSQFPLPIYDDGLAADALLGEPEDQKKGIFALEFPESDEAANLRDALAWRKSRRRGEMYDEAGSTWMSDGL